MAQVVIVHGVSVVDLSWDLIVECHLDQPYRRPPRLPHESGWRLGMLFLHPLGAVIRGTIRGPRGLHSYWGSIFLWRRLCASIDLNISLSADRCSKFDMRTTYSPSNTAICREKGHSFYEFRRAVGSWSTGQPPRHKQGVGADHYYYLHTKRTYSYHLVSRPALVHL